MNLGVYKMLVAQKIHWSEKIRRDVLRRENSYSSFETFRLKQNENFMLVVRNKIFRLEKT